MHVRLNQFHKLSFNFLKAFLCAKMSFLLPQKGKYLKAEESGEAFKKPPVILVFSSRWQAVSTDGLDPDASTC